MIKKVSLLIFSANFLFSLSNKMEIEQRERGEAINFFYKEEPNFRPFAIGINLTLGFGIGSLIQKDYFTALIANILDSLALTSLIFLLKKQMEFPNIEVSPNEGLTHYKSLEVNILFITTTFIFISSRIFQVLRALTFKTYIEDDNFIAAQITSNFNLKEGFTLSFKKLLN